MEKRIAHPASLSKFFALLILLCCSAAYAKDAEDLNETLTKKAFGKVPAESECKTLSKHPKGDVKAIDEKLNKQIQDYVEAWRSSDYKAIFSSLHPDAQKQFSEYKVSMLIKHIKMSYGEPVEFSVLRIWALNVKDGRPNEMHCPDEELSIYPQYGYPLQIALWMQVRGEKELGRLLTLFVVSKNELKIASLHLQQWTFGGKDPGTWLEDAEKDNAGKRYLSAFVKYDLSKKLIEEGGSLIYPDRKLLNQRLTDLKSTHNWDKAVRSSLDSFMKDYKVPRIASFHANKDGASLLLYIMFNKETSQKDRDIVCKSMGEKLFKDNLLKGLAGVRCNYLYPQHPDTEEGPLKGAYYRF